MAHLGLRRCCAAELAVTPDADLEYHPLDLLKLVQVFLDEQADAVFGSRFLASKYRRVLLLETSVPGIFVVGDVRHGSVKRVASGVGEGAVVVQFMHQYLAKVQ